MRNDFAVAREHKDKDGFVYVFIDTKKAVFRNLRWTELGDWGKRKCENMLFLTRQNRRDKIKIKYYV